MKPFRIAVMYGSQTGNAQSIGEGVHECCRQKGLESTLLKCDGWKKMTPALKEWSAVVFVVSTTGNGDPPENTERFWRFIKRRTQPKDLLAGLPFALLGLGDTNYDKFCYMGKSFDKRLRELGATPFHTPAFADEATNMEETVEPWLSSLYVSLESLRNVGGGQAATTAAVAAASGGRPETSSAVVGDKVEGDASPIAAAAVALNPIKDDGVHSGESVSRRRSSAGDNNGNGVSAVSAVQREGGIARVAHTQGGELGGEESRGKTGLPVLGQVGPGLEARASAELTMRDEAVVEGSRRPCDGTPEIGVPGWGAALAVEKERLPPHRFAVMYGSQTGNAQSIAEGIHEGCTERGLESTLLKCDGWKKMTPELTQWTAAILVISTTGNGDPPENTERFWRFLKRRTQPKDLLKGLQFALLGLGDTNYDKFCYMGKSFDKRLRELGATPFHTPAFADEATNMEETVEPWLSSLFAAVRSLVSATSGTDGAGVTGEGTDATVPRSVPSPPSSPASCEVVSPNGNSLDAVAAAAGGGSVDGPSTDVRLTDEPVTASSNGDSPDAVPAAAAAAAPAPARVDEPSTDVRLTDGPTADGPSTDVRLTDGPTADGPTMDGPTADGCSTGGASAGRSAAEPAEESAVVAPAVVVDSLKKESRVTLSLVGLLPDGSTTAGGLVKQAENKGLGGKEEERKAMAAAITVAATTVFDSVDNEEKEGKITTASDGGAAVGVARGAGTADAAAAGASPAGVAATAEAIARLRISDPKKASCASPAQKLQTPSVSNGNGNTDSRGKTAPMMSAPWSPSGESGSLPISAFLNTEHLAPGYAPPRKDLPRVRAGPPDIHFCKPDGGGGAGGGAGETADDDLWLRRARQRSSSVESRHTFDWPFAAWVQGARYLTKGGRQAERRVILMEVSLKGSGITYEPGDVIGVRCPNPPCATAYILDRLRNTLPPDGGPDVAFQHSLRSLPSPCTLREALSTRLDLQTPLRRPMLRVLAGCCEDARERAWMELLCAKTTGGDVYARFVAAQSLTLCELLEAFPSCKPGPSALLALLPPLPPRYYSVACSQMATPGSVSVAFSVVRHLLPRSSSSSCSGSATGTGGESGGIDSDGVVSDEAGVGGGTEGIIEGGEEGEKGGGVVRRGVCTNWLEEILTPLLLENGVVSSEDERRAAGKRAGIFVPLFVKPTKEFLLPASAKWPCVLIGPGTGVAPFVGFLKHREQQLARRRETVDAVCSGYWRGGYEISLEGEEDETEAYRGREGRGDMWLFFGCRSESQDWIFRKEMEGFLSNGTLSRLTTAFSRDGPEKVYVQNRILDSGAELSRLMLHEGAYVYVCGDGNAMAQGVHKALVQALVEHGGVGGEEAAEAALRGMKERNRYVLDVWS